MRPWGASWDRRGLEGHGIQADQADPAGLAQDVRVRSASACRQVGISWDRLVPAVHGGQGVHFAGAFHPADASSGRGARVLPSALAAALRQVVAPHHG